MEEIRKINAEKGIAVSGGHIIRRMNYHYGLLGQPGTVVKPLEPCTDSSRSRAFLHRFRQRHAVRLGKVPVTQHMDLEEMRNKAP